MFKNRLVLAAMALLLSYSSALGSGNSTAATNAVNRYVKGLQNGKCTSLFDMINVYDELIAMDKSSKPKVIWPQIEKKYRDEWTGQCSNFEKTMSEKTTEPGNTEHFFYVTPQTKWKIIETRPSIARWWDVFVRVDYPKQDTPCEYNYKSDENRLLKSRIYKFYVSFSKGKVFVSRAYMENLNDTFEFYPDSCEEKSEYN